MQRADKLMYQFAAHTLTAPLLHALTTVVGARSLSRERILMLGRTPLAERIMREAETRAGVCGSSLASSTTCLPAWTPPIRLCSDPSAACRRSSTTFARIGLSSRSPSGAAARRFKRCSNRASCAAS